ncbi:uncharacterized protein [Palaemon carinicauda]|uniref:uncharacterized protein n=1 Tax=Palaemon carinicauda TaxID=392227 RepID=UPI0035B5CF60
MKFLVLVSTVFAVASAAPQGYSLPAPVGPSFPIGGCANGEVLNVDGTCALPHVTRNVFVYTAPEQPISYGPPPAIPGPRQEYNIIFIRTPEVPRPQDPIIVGPPEQKNVVYVLSRRPEFEGQKVIEVPAPPPASPQVYFVNYGDGENPTLPGGIDLQTALGSAAAAGGTIIGGGGFDGGAALGGAGGFGGAGLGGAGLGGVGGFGGAGLGGGDFGGAGFGGGLGGGLGGGFGGFDDSHEDGGVIISGGGAGLGGGSIVSPVTPSGLYSTP